MAIVDIPTLKSYFEAGDQPSRQEFEDLIDTLASLSGEANFQFQTARTEDELRTHLANPNVIFINTGDQNINLESANGFVVVEGVKYIQGEGGVTSLGATILSTQTLASCYMYFQKLNFHYGIILSDSGSVIDFRVGEAETFDRDSLVSYGGNTTTIYKLIGTLEYEANLTVYATSDKLIVNGLMGVDSTSVGNLMWIGGSGNADIDTYLRNFDNNVNPFGKDLVVSASGDTIHGGSIPVEGDYITSVKYGHVDWYDTSGISSGDVMWYDPVANDGSLTNVEPAFQNGWKIKVGTVKQGNNIADKLNVDISIMQDASGSGGQTLYDGVDTKANILALPAPTYQEEAWFASDTKEVLVSTTAFGVDYQWQVITPRYDETTDTFEFPATRDGQTQNVGQEVFFNGYYEGTLVNALDPKVFIAQGYQPTNTRFQNLIQIVAGDVNEGMIFGLNTTNIGVGDVYGKLLTYGYLNNVNTSAWLENDILYVDPTTAGDITNIMPSISAFTIGKVIKSDPTEGIIFVDTICSNRIDSATIPLGIDRVFMTADEETTGAGTFYLAKIEDRGTIASATEVINCPDNTITASTQDHVNDATPEPFTITAGVRDGQIEFQIDNDLANERIYLEIYDADSDGVALDSGIVSQPVGDLGVKPILVLRTPLMDATEDVRQYISIDGLLEADYEVVATHRLRFHWLCEKVGVAGAAVNFTLYWGSDHDSYINSLSQVTIDDVAGLTEALDERVKWVYPWVSASYENRTMTRIGDWTSISNKATSDYPVPLPSENPQWGLVPSPTFATITTTGDNWIGFEFTLTDSVLFRAFRVWITTRANQEYTAQLYDFNNPNDPRLLLSKFIPSGSPEGWLEIQVEELLSFFAGERFRIIVINHVTTTDVTYSGLWQSQLSGLIPSAGFVSFTGESGFVRIDSNETAGGPDRTTDLLLLNDGDLINIAEDGDGSRFTNYRVVGPATDEGTYIEIPVIVNTQGNQVRDNRLCDVTWDVYGAPSDTDYVRQLNGIPTYFPDGQVAGLFGTDVNDVTNPAYATDNNIYGVDIYSEDLVQSPDWDIVAYSGVSGGGGGTSGTTLDNQLINAGAWIPDSLNNNQRTLIYELGSGATKGTYETIVFPYDQTEQFTFQTQPQVEWVSKVLRFRVTYFVPSGSSGQTVSFKLEARGVKRAEVPTATSYDSVENSFILPTVGDGGVVRHEWVELTLTSDWDTVYSFLDMRLSRVDTLGANLTTNVNLLQVELEFMEPT